MNNFMNYDFKIDSIVFAGHIPAGAGSPVHKDRSSHGLAVNIYGEKEYHFSDGQTLVLKANNIIYLPKHSTYTVSSKIPGDCYAINFDVDEDIECEPFVISIKKHNAVIGFFHIAQKVWQQKTVGYHLKCKAELYNIIYTMHQEYFSDYSPKSKFAIIKPAVDYIHTKYTDTPVNIAALSEMCNISTEYLRRIFKSVYGVTPIAYINNLKITRAKELLKSQMYSISDVAFLSGFNEISCFSREFKKMTGISPSDYKKGN